MKQLLNDYSITQILLLWQQQSVIINQIEFSEKKIKKDNNELNIKFEKTRDILFELGQNKKASDFNWFCT